ncbi:SAF domain-containing protein, partial [Vibrio toranzoniae]|uniref:SAF domain-containing protein n=1 Tax=Vibrio toranzoniae TaxID=1194427 RepID=UPI001F369DC8
SLGHVNYERTEAAKGNVKFRRSLYVVKDIDEGEEFTPENVRSIRPGFGLAPKYYSSIIGGRAKVSLIKGTPLSFQYVDK